MWGNKVLFVSMCPLSSPSLTYLEDGEFGEPQRVAVAVRTRDLFSPSERTVRHIQ